LQVDEDIVAALDKGILAAATLDVFPTEPLPPDSPLRAHPKITITPHNAAFSDPRSIALNMLRQIERFESGQPFKNVVDRDTGY
jgi:glyoxylate/hydroxypyruvate reductase A